MSSELLKQMLYNALSYGAVGFGVCAAVGVAKTYFNRNTTPNDDVTGIEQGYTNIKYDPYVLEGLQRLLPYKNHASTEYIALQDNIDKLIGLQILINQGKPQASFPYKATRHFVNIENALRNMEFKIRNSVTPHFKVDKDSFLELANDYKHNITKDVSAFIINNRTV